MAMFPIHSNFQGDFVVQLVAVDSDDTMDEVAAKCAYHSVGRRVKGKTGVLRVRRHKSSNFFDRSITVSESGIKPTEVLDVVYDG